MPNYGDLIHAAIRKKIKEFEFPSVVYPDKYTRVSDASSPAKPRAIVIDQQSSTFEDRQSRRDRTRERTVWTWIADVHFNGAVSFEEFEDDFANNPPRILRDATDGRPRQVDIFLDEAELYVHPPRKGPSTGSRARWRFVAELSRT